MKKPAKTSLSFKKIPSALKNPQKSLPPENILCLGIPCPILENLILLGISWFLGSVGPYLKVTQLNLVGLSFLYCIPTKYWKKH